MPARVFWLVLLANVGAIAVLAWLMASVNNYLKSVAVSGMTSIGIAPDSARQMGMLVWLGIVFIEFAASMWLIYNIMVPRLWPEAKRRLTEDDDEWSKEDVIIFLLLVVIVLLIAS